MEDAGLEEHRAKKTHLLFGIKRKKGGQFQRGIGGFRPVWNWREVTIRKRKVADAQLLVCIYSFGFAVIALGVVFFFLGLYVIKPQCPFHWTGIQDRCLYISNHNTTWPSARHFCAEQGGHMMDIASEEENREVNDKIASPTWIGLYRNKDSPALKWETGSPVVFSKFSSPPSPGTPPFTECVRINVDGTWKLETNCNLRFPAACEYGKFYFPFILIGPVLVICGCIILLLSIEVCKRHHKTKKKAENLLEEEELPNVDEEENVKKADPLPNKSSVVGTPKLSWRRYNNKTAPAKSPPSKILNVHSPKGSIVKYISGVESPQLSVKLNSMNSSSTNTPASQSKSPEQMELLLSPKNL